MSKFVIIVTHDAK